MSEIRLQRRPSINIINNTVVGEVVAVVPVRVALVPWTPCINITATIVSQACPPPDPPTQSMGYSGSVPIITPTMPIMPPQTLAKIVAKGNVKVRNEALLFFWEGYRKQMINALPQFDIKNLGYFKKNTDYCH